MSPPPHDTGCSPHRFSLAPTHPLKAAGWAGRGVKNASRPVRTPSTTAGAPSAGRIVDLVMANLIGGIVALALLAYLGYALIRPDKF
jgi:K+-transporting ATPase KdpF subunit